MRTGHTPTFSSFLEEGPTQAGPLGMVTQSGAFGTHLLALAARRGIQVGVWMSTGNEADVAVADGISFMADDPETQAIACYVEAIKDGALFAEAVARARNNGKPVIAMKVGGSAVGAAAAASHTASLAGSDAVYDAALRQLGHTDQRLAQRLIGEDDPHPSQVHGQLWQRPAGQRHALGVWAGARDRHDPVTLLGKVRKLPGVAQKR